MAHISALEIRASIPSLTRFAISLTRDHDRASDLVQDCVERCLRKQHLFDGENLTSWMVAVCRRVFLNQVRKERGFGIPVDLDEAPGHALASPAHQDADLGLRDLHAQMQALPAGDQAVLRLIAVEGLKYHEVAAKLEVPVGTVRSRLSRARERLRARLDLREAA